MSGDGREVVFESYQAKLAIAKRQGEIAVMARRLGAAAPVLASGEAVDPRSNYNPALSADGRWVAFESAIGNLNFAKRYGRMQVLVRDLRSGRTLVGLAPARPGDLALRLQPVDLGRRPARRLRGLRPAGRAGRRHARRRARPAQRPRARAGGRRRRRSRGCPPTGGGSRYSALVGGRSEVFVRDLRGGRMRRVSGAGEEAWEPALSARGDVVAYTAADARRRTSHVGGRATCVGAAAAPQVVIRSPAGSGLAFEPSLSASGRRVAFVARPAGTRQTQVFVRDLRRGATQLASRASGPDGPPGMGSAAHPALSGDGRRVAFTSDAWNLTPDKCNSARGVFVRDLARATTARVSSGDGENRFLGPTKGSSAGGDSFVTLLCA